MTELPKRNPDDLPQSLRDFPIFNCLVRERRLVSFANRLDDIQVFTVGDFVARGAEEVFRRIRTTENNQQRVRRILAAFDL